MSTKELPDAERCRFHSRAWNVRCDRPIGHVGDCVSRGDAFAGGWDPEKGPPGGPADLAHSRPSDITTAIELARKVDGVPTNRSPCLTCIGCGEPLSVGETTTCRHCARHHDPVKTLARTVLVLAAERDTVEQRTAEQIAIMCERWAVDEHAGVGRGATALYLAEKIRSGAWKIP